MDGLWHFPELKADHPSPVTSALRRLFKACASASTNRPHDMRYSLIALLLATAYCAAAFFSIKYSSSRYWSESVRAIYGLTFASGLIFGYDRRYTPAIAFGVIGFTVAYFVNGPSFALSLWLERFGLFDRSVMQNLAVVATAKHHLAMLAAVAAFFVWKRLSIRPAHGRHPSD